MDSRIFRNRLFGAICDEFPDATVAKFPDGLQFMVSEVINGKRLAVPVSVSGAEVASAKHHDALISVYVAAMRSSWDAAIKQPPAPSSVTPTTSAGNP